MPSQANPLCNEALNMVEEAQSSQPPEQSFTQSQLNRFRVLSDFERLEVDEDASLEKIHEAYRRASKLYHPDAHPLASPEEQTRLNEAFRLLRVSYERLVAGNAVAANGSTSSTDVEAYHQLIRSRYEGAPFKTAREAKFFFQGFSAKAHRNPTAYRAARQRFLSELSEQLIRKAKSFDQLALGLALADKLPADQKNRLDSLIATPEHLVTFYLLYGSDVPAGMSAQRFESQLVNRVDRVSLVTGLSRMEILIRAKTEWGRHTEFGDGLEYSFIRSLSAAVLNPTPKDVEALRIAIQRVQSHAVLGWLQADVLKLLRNHPDLRQKIIDEFGVDFITKLTKPPARGGFGVGRRDEKAVLSLFERIRYRFRPAAIDTPPPRQSNPWFEGQKLPSHLSLPSGEGFVPVDLSPMQAIAGMSFDQAKRFIEQNYGAKIIVSGEVEENLSKEEYPYFVDLIQKGYQGIYIPSFSPPTGLAFDGRDVIVMREENLGTLLHEFNHLLVFRAVHSAKLPGNHFQTIDQFNELSNRIGTSVEGLLGPDIRASSQRRFSRTEFIDLLRFHQTSVQINFAMLRHEWLADQFTWQAVELDGYSEQRRHENMSVNERQFFQHLNESIWHLQTVLTIHRHHLTEGEKMAANELLQAFQNLKSDHRRFIKDLKYPGVVTIPSTSIPLNSSPVP